MKRTELEKRERKLKRTQKKDEVIARKMSNSRKNSVNDYIEGLSSLFRYDANEIFNASEDMQILELFMEMKETLPDKQWENVLKKAIKKTGVVQKDRAFDELKALLDEA